MQATQTVVFAPQNKLQVKALLQFITNNRDSINAGKTAEYVQAVNKVKQIMRDYFTVNPPKLTAFCPWKYLGTNVMCEAIANTFSVPYWDVIAEANPYN